MWNTKSVQRGKMLPPQRFFPGGIVTIMGDEGGTAGAAVGMVQAWVGHFVAPLKRRQDVSD